MASPDGREFRPSFASPVYLSLTAFFSLLTVGMVIFGIIAVAQGGSYTNLAFYGGVAVIAASAPFVLRLGPGIRVEDGRVYTHRKDMDGESIGNDEVEYVYYKGSTGYLIAPGAIVRATLPTYLAKAQLREIAAAIDRPFREHRKPVK